MQRKADAAVIDKAKSINRNWREVKVWGKSVTGGLAHEDQPHPFSVPEEEVGVNMDDFSRMRKQNPVFSRIYASPPEKDPKSLMTIILDATNEYITARRDGRTHSVSKQKKNLKPVSLECANLPGYRHRYPNAHKLSPFA
jgi:hypothetical protein